MAEVDPQGGIRTALCPVTVGREPEMRRLRDAIGAVREGDSRVVVLAGDAGLGKTRLAADLRRAASEAGLATMWGGCSEAELSLPYLPFLEAVGNHLSQANLPAIRRQLTANHRELAWLFPQLEMAEPPQDPSDPVQGKLRLFEAVLSLFRICAQPAGLLVVLENHNVNAEKSARNVYGVKVILGRNLNVRDLLNHDWLLMTKAAVEQAGEVLK